MSFLPKLEPPPTPVPLELWEIPPEHLVAIEILCVSLSRFRQTGAPGLVGVIAREWQRLGWLGAWSTLGQYIHWHKNYKNFNEVITGSPEIWRELIKNGDFGKFVFPVLRRVYPALIANEIVAVQPMTSSIGAIFAFDYKYGSKHEDGDISGYTRNVPEPIPEGPIWRKPIYGPHRPITGRRSCFRNPNEPDHPPYREIRRDWRTWSGIEYSYD